MRRKLLLIVAVLMVFTASAGRLSTHSKQFLLHYHESLTADTMGGPKKSPAQLKHLGGRDKSKKFPRTVKINNVEMVSAFVGLNGHSKAELEAAGAIITTEFDGFVVAQLPVDKLEQIASLASVKRVDVARVMQHMTDASVITTNVDKVKGDDFASYGLPQKYDGTGVVASVIDDGIDFQHPAYKDASGNTRIKRVYQPQTNSSNTFQINGVSFGGTQYTTTSQIGNLTTDDTGESHGTHTSTTVAGTWINGYGGMAPGADIVLCALGEELYDTYLASAAKYVATYAQSVGKPCIISISIGSLAGPHDGTDYLAQAYTQVTGQGKIITLSAANSGGENVYAKNDNVTSSSPFQVVLDGGLLDYGWPSGFYYQETADVWARSANVPLQLTIKVINKSNNSVLGTIGPFTEGDAGMIGPSAINFSSGERITKNDVLASYYTYSSQMGQYAMLEYSVTKDEYNDKYNASVFMYNMYPHNTNYYIAIDVKPVSSSATTAVDAWMNGYGSFSDATFNISGHNFVKGNDHCSVGSEVMAPGVISIGAYVVRNTVKSINNKSYTASDYTVGDIAPFSSWANEGPRNSVYPDDNYPFISAPGAITIAGVNHYDTDNYPASPSSASEYTTVASTTSNGTTFYYGSMSGTSMACPTAAGIVALWLQADPTLTPDRVRNLMRTTAIHDSYTDGTNSAHFGHGKIDALAGLLALCPTGPTINVSPSSLAFEGYATMSYTQTVTVRGRNLEGNITASITGGGGIYSVSPTTISKAAAEAGTTLTITYAPTAAGNTSATLTLSSTNADDVAVSLNGVAQAATPTLMVEPASLAFDAGLDEAKTQTFTVSGRFIDGDVTLTLSDANDVFSISPSTIAATDLADGAEVQVTVTFLSDAEGDYSGAVTISCDGAESRTVSLSATASDGGTAGDNYLNIAKYATIDEAGWNKTYVNTLYQYTPYEADECAWLTLPVYGAFVGARYATNSSTVGSGNPQGWIQTSLGTSNTYAGTSWTYTASSTNPYNGSSAYFTGASGAGAARAIGYNNRTNTTVRAVSFYVTNCTAVKLLGMGARGASSTYPAAIKVYECTVSNGVPTAATTVEKSATSTSTSTTTAFNIGVTGLDASKVYKVETSIYRGYLYEIAFKTPILVPKSLATVVDEDIANKTYQIADGDLTCVAVSADGKTLYCKDDNGYASKSANDNNALDYMSQTGLQSGVYDQSNWVAITLPKAIKTANELEGYMNHTLTDVVGTWSNDNGNCTLIAKKKPTPGERNPYQMNVFITSSLLGTQTAANGKSYYFVTPKPMEVAEITWAMWSNAKNAFVVPLQTTAVNTAGLDGGFYANFDLIDESFTPVNGAVYNFVGLIRQETASSSKLNRAPAAGGDNSHISTDYVVYPLEMLGTNGGVVTAVTDLRMSQDSDGTYYNLLGQPVKNPTPGIYIRGGKKVIVR